MGLPGPFGRKLTASSQVVLEVRFWPKRRVSLRPLLTGSRHSGTERIAIVSNGRRLVKTRQAIPYSLGEREFSRFFSAFEAIGLEIWR